MRLSTLNRCLCEVTVSNGFEVEHRCPEHDTKQFRKVLHLLKTLERLRIAREIENELYELQPEMRCAKKIRKHLVTVRNKV